MCRSCYVTINRSTSGWLYSQEKPHNKGFHPTPLARLIGGFMRFVADLVAKVVFPGEGAVGVENTVVVTEDGYEVLTPVDEEIFEV